MKHWLSQLNAAAEAHRAEHQARRDEKARAEAEDARVQMTPLGDRLTRPLATVPIDV